MKQFLLTTALLAVTVSAAAQKKPLDHDVYDGWQAVSGVTLSHSGKVIAYAVNPQEGDGTLYIRVSGKKSARTIEIPRGYKVQLLDNAAWAVCLVKPEFQKTRRAKIKKLTAGKKSIKVKWMKRKKKMSSARITGYQVQVATNKKFTKNKKTKKVKGYKKTTKTFKNLKGGKKYYVRVRTYKTIKGVKYYSPWSKVKKITTK